MRRRLLIPLVLLAGCSVFTSRRTTPADACVSISAPTADIAMAAGLATTASILATPDGPCERCGSRTALATAAVAGALALAFASSAAYGYGAPSSCTP